MSTEEGMSTVGCSCVLVPTLLPSAPAIEQLYLCPSCRSLDCCKLHVLLYSTTGHSWKLLHTPESHCTQQKATAHTWNSYCTQLRGAVHKRKLLYLQGREGHAVWWLRKKSYSAGTSDRHFSRSPAARPSSTMPGWLPLWARLCCRCEQQRDGTVNQGMVLPGCGFLFVQLPPVVLAGLAPAPLIRPPPLYSGRWSHVL